jgi:hypothetical protein
LVGGCRKVPGTYVGGFILNLNNWRGEYFKPTSHARSNWSSYGKDELRVLTALWGCDIKYFNYLIHWNR